MEIKWMDSFRGAYLISNDGQLKNKKTGKILKPCKDKDGYLYYGLFFNGERSKKRAHRLVAEAFLSDYSNDLQVNHKDLNRENNNIDNLEMLTLEENIRYSAQKGSYIRRGMKNNNCKYDDIKIITILTCAGKFTDTYIAKELGLKRKYVNDVKLGKRRGI